MFLSQLTSGVENTFSWLSEFGASWVGPGLRALFPSYSAEQASPQSMNLQQLQTHSVIVCNTKLPSAFSLQTVYFLFLPSHLLLVILDNNGATDSTPCHLQISSAKEINLKLL